MKKPNKNRYAFIASLYSEGQSFNKVSLIWNKYETEIHDSIKNHGQRHTLAIYKSCYMFLRNKILQLPTQPIPFCKADRNGIPKPLWSLRPLIKGDRNDKRVALSIVRTYELITLPIDYSTKSIEEPSLEGKDFQETTKLFNKFLEEFTNKYPWYLGSLQVRNPYEPRVFTTLSKGPNGPAVSCAHLDAKGVIQDGKLFQSIKELNSALRQDWITEWMIEQSNSFDTNIKYLTGRLGFSAEPGGKTRIFAIGDYWSQTSLKVIQDSLYNTLKSISTDSTENQDKGFKDLLQDSKGKPTHCFDLSAASDRIPAIMQKTRLELLGGKKLGDAWHKVMTDRSFTIKTTGRKVRWTVGQPLGLLSSFPSFALWHHDIIQYSANLERMNNGKPLKFFKDYKLLGDDVVIYDSKVAGVYHQLLTEVIGIPINDSKSIIGNSQNSQIEFTKRFSLDGTEMSSVKHNILTKNNLVNMLDLVDIMFERDFIPTNTGSHVNLQTLNQRDQEKFSFMLWVRSHIEPSFEGGNSTFEITRDDFNQRLKEKRAQNIMEKTILIDKYMMEAKPLNTYYEKDSLPHDMTALGLGRYDTGNLKLHPLVWAINQTGLDLSICLSRIWDDEGPDVAPVEYLPIVSSKSYFHNRKTRGEYLSKLIIDTYTELRDESLSVKNTRPD
jgi:hypothetical protein